MLTASVSRWENQRVVLCPSVARKEGLLERVSGCQDVPTGVCALARGSWSLFWLGDLPGPVRTRSLMQIAGC